MPRYYFGQIVLAYVKDGAGGTKEHPTLVIGSDEDCASGGPLQVVVISTRIEEPCPDFHIRVHDGHKTDPRTGLYKPCVAKCNWVQDVEPRRVIKGLGSMPDDLLDPIIAKVNELISDENFVDWVDHD